MKSNLIRTIVFLALITFMSVSVLSQAVPNLDQILKEISTYNGGIESGPIWKLRDYVYSHKEPVEARTDCEAKLLAFLSTNATPVSKMAVIRHLRIIGGDRSVTALAPMLLDGNMADHALYAVEKIPGTAADQALIEAMSKAGGAIKTELIASLGRRKTTAAVASLSPLLKGEFAVAAAAALGEIGGDSACTALQPAFSAADAAARSTMASSLLKCAEGYRAGQNDAASGAIYKKLAAVSNLPLSVRKAAMLGKISTSGSRAASMVADLLRGFDVPMQEVGISKIKENFTAETIGTVCSLVPKLPESSQIKVLAVLSGYPKDRVLPTVLQAAKSESLAVRTAAYGALENVGDVSALGLLLESASKNRGAEQTAARNTIALLKGRPVDDKIIEMLGQNPAEEIGVELLQAVSERRIFAAKVVVAKNLQSPAARVRTQSLRTLRVIGTPSDIPTILNYLLSTEDEADQTEAIGTTAALAQKINNPESRAAAVRNRLMREQTAKNRIQLFQALSRIGDDSALPILRAELTNTDDAIADAATRAICSWTSVAARNDVLSLAQKSRNETHRMLAFEAFIRLVRTDRNRQPEAAVADLRQAYALANRPEDKRLILGVLPNFTCPEALDLAATMLGDSAVKAEAQAALDRMKTRPAPKKR